MHDRRRRHPFDWHLHLVWLLAVAGRWSAAYLWARRAGGPVAGDGPPAGAVRLGVVVLVGAVTWPLADLAAHWLLMALVLQRLLLTLAVPPLLVLGHARGPCSPASTRPAAVDAVLRVAVRPVPAVGDRHRRGRGDADHRGGRSGRPLGRGPGGDRAGRARPRASCCGRRSDRAARGAAASRRSGRGGYLIVQSIVPSFLSIVWIFARHSLYPPLRHSKGRSSA